jgi:hypothetical protein
MNHYLLGALAATCAVSAVARADASLAVTPRTEAECASLFIRRDANSDGEISRSEAKADPVIARAFDGPALADTDHLTVQQFMDVCKQPRAAPEAMDK